MARRAFLSHIAAPPAAPSSRAYIGPASSPRIPHPPASGALGERRSVPPPSAPGALLANSEGISLTASIQLLDRLAAADEAPFLVAWIEGVLAGRTRMDPMLAVRLLRGYRETGRIDRARELAASLPAAPASWPPLELARLAIERAILGTLDGRVEHADAELRQAVRVLNLVPKGAGLREQLDLHIASAQLELKLNRAQHATAALRMAEHVADRIEDGPWRTPVSMTLGHLAMRLSDPRTASKHYTSALSRASTRSAAAMSAHANLAIALCSIARFDDAREHAEEAVSISKTLAAGWGQADACDVLAIVELSADRPGFALQAVDEAHAALGDLEEPMMRYQLAAHRTWAFAVLGRAPAARQWLARTEKLRSDLAVVEELDEQDFIAIKARTLEACGRPREALDLALPFAERLPETYVTGSLNLALGRCALAVEEEALARAAVERAALSGDRYGWVFPERMASASLWKLALRSGDSRVVRYAERMMTLANAPPPTHSARASMMPPLSEADLPPPAVDPPIEAETLIYVTTLQGVSRVPRAELPQYLQGATLVVDTLAHALRVNDRELSLERRRALEPLLVQLLRRAREGLSADEVLRAAGGPGPESADAEHRVRVLISRVRDLLGDPAAIERVRDAGEYGKTRYRLAPNIPFALVEPLFSSTQ